MDKQSASDTSVSRLNDQRRALTEWAGAIAGDIRQQEPMSLHTTFQIGGPADWFYEPSNETQFNQIMVACKACGIPVTVIGRGSNLLVSDRGIRGMVVALGKNYSRISEYSASQLSQSPWFDELGRDGLRGDVYYLYAEAGALLSDLSNYAARNDWTGLEFACGIPGTTGGAVYMNAGAYGSSMSDVVIATRYFDESSQVKTLVGAAHEFDYRHSLFRRSDALILGTLVMLQRGDHALITQLMDDYNSRRASTQPLEFPCAGSIFKRPPGHYTGKLITDSGLKGKRIGDAMVSEKHAGFIVNDGAATARDVISLIREIQQTIYERYEVHLETELRLVGEYTEEELSVSQPREP
ncbi:MAG: UDP-N-acetylmuramate dehydrogenase [Fastidiosipilaceae bacterium]|jgi:UDP-N-acetylmuramate dehydrogenase